MRDEPTDDPAEGGAPLLIRVGAIFHKVEIAYVVVMLVIATWGVVRMDREMLDFAIIFGVACFGAAIIALWPRTPALLHFSAETVLLVVAIGQLIGPRHEVLTLLNRELKGANHWNAMPLTDRRIVAWNLVASLGLVWLLPGLAMLARIRSVGRRSPSVAAAGVIALVIIWPMMALLFVLILQAFFF